MALVRRTLKKIRRMKRRTDRTKIKQTTEADIRRHMIEDAQDYGSSRVAKKLPPVHPGEILREEFLVPLKLTPYAVAAALGVARTRIERIAREEKPVTADTALRLGKFFKTSAAFWMNIQVRFDLETAEAALAPQIKKIATYEAA